MVQRNLVWVFVWSKIKIVRKEKIMKVRVKFAKFGALKFIGHLDVMRYMQKLIRKSGIDVAYSQGFNPHQLLFFASPLGVGLTSEGEYFDIVLNSAEPDIVEKLNAVTVDGIKFLDSAVLKEKSKNSMSIIASGKYIMELKEEYRDGFSLGAKEFSNKFTKFLSKDKIVVNKKTKKSEREVDLAPLIYEYEVREDFSVYMHLSAGSEENLKPQLVMETFLEEQGVEYKDFAFQVHRIELLAKNDEGALVPLMEIDRESPVSAN